MCSKFQNEIQARSNQRSFQAPTESMAVPGTATASGLGSHSWYLNKFSVLCWEFLEQSLVFNQSLFSSCRTLSTHISKALTKFLRLRIFLTPNGKQPGWSCGCCPCSWDSPVWAGGLQLPGPPGASGSTGNVLNNCNTPQLHSCCVHQLPPYALLLLCFSDIFSKYRILQKETEALLELIITSKITTLP